MEHVLRMGELQGITRFYSEVSITARPFYERFGFAWYFWFAVSFGGENGLQKLGLCGIHPLTQRYVHKMDCRYG